MEKIKFSALLSVYIKEIPNNLDLALESITDNQSLKPNEIVLIKDGKLTDELEKIIDKYINKYPTLFKIVAFEKNRGLGEALRVGVLECSYEYIARMDTDDIAKSDRFEKQIRFLRENPNIDIVGSHITEFIDTTDNIICEKRVPLDNIEKYIRHRSPLNHPTVVFKKSSVLEVGNYIEIPFNEDIYLWARMVAGGKKIANIDESLLYFRTTDDTYKRRGGIKYIKSEYKIQKELLRLRIINLPTFIFNICSKSVVRLLPNSIRKMIYMKVLRK